TRPWGIPNVALPSRTAARCRGDVSGAAAAAARYAGVRPPSAPTGTSGYQTATTRAAAYRINSQHVGCDVRVVAHQRPILGLPRLHATGDVHDVEPVVVEPCRRL